MSGLSQLESFICTLYDTKDQLKRHIFDRSDAAFRQGDQDRDDIRSLEQLKARKQRMRRKFLEAVGGLPADAPSLNARTTGTIRQGNWRIENVIFESRPGHYVTANLYVPDGSASPGPAVLFLCGHERDAKHSDLYRKVCIRLVQAGLIVLAVDPIGQGERFSYMQGGGPGTAVSWGTAEHQHAGAQCLPLGEGLARYFLHDAMRAVDYLLSRPEVDPSRIGVTGNSGGGTQTAMMMLCDDRIAAAAPGTFIMNRKDYMHAGGVQDAEQVWPGLSAAGFDHEDLLLAFAPRPVLVLAAAYDFFPIEATRRTVERSQRFWELYGQGGRLRLAEDQTLHSYTDVLAKEAAVFFRRQLAGNSREVDWTPEMLPLDGSRLQCTGSGQVVTEFADARVVRDENEAQAAKLAAWRAEQPEAVLRRRGLAWLADRVIGPRLPSQLNPRRMPLGCVDGLEAEYLLWWSQPGLMNSAIRFRKPAAVPSGGESGAAGSCSTVRGNGEEAFASNGSSPLRAANAADRENVGDVRPSAVAALWEGGTTALERHGDWIKETCASGREVYVLNVSGMGPHEPYPIYRRPALPFFGVLHKLSDDLLWIGDSLAAVRAYDVIRCLDLIGQVSGLGGEAVDFYTAGRTNLYVKLAAALDPRVGAADVVDPLPEVSAWVSAALYEEEDAMSYILPGMLNYFDLADLDRWRLEGK
ncbi:alpha/beta hydrolase family protein [Paenibacillus nasutitermitis]|uniref:Xylan esterase n=1 Tax=Paenibacillus nasutitermitis TaxID=1652958 RepID=A0A916Z9K3_9BACL|nr:acetylxylan esterase [Paenibacillus nasutitermitis]GGD82959.1 xylan esterase [Paenibacillus nasutitermitis]